jgi:hypothetical protein
MNSLIATAGGLLVWQTWLQARLRFSALGRARRDFRSAVQRLGSSHLWLCRDRGTVFSICYRRVAGVRVLIVSKYRRDDFYAIAKEGSAPVEIGTYRLTPVHLRVLRRFDLERYTTTGERTDPPNTRWSGFLRDLRRISAQTIYATPAELNDAAAQIRSAERWAAKAAREPRKVR